MYNLKHLTIFNPKMWSTPTSTPTWLSWLTNSASGFTCKYCHISWSSPHLCDYLGLQMLLLAFLANLFSASYNYRTISLQPSGFPQVQRLDHTLTCFSNKLSLKKKVKKNKMAKVQQAASHDTSGNGTTG